ncbi:hypothetical protein, partial [Escherichia coli]|uniref:hypothetical protein n=1 Tax=Escherichia coli TaxID=562 RepID=UPI001AA0BAF5
QNIRINISQTSNSKNKYCKNYNNDKIKSGVEEQNPCNSTMEDVVSTPSPSIELLVVFSMV